MLIHNSGCANFFPDMKRQISFFWQTKDGVIHIANNHILQTLQETIWMALLKNLYSICYAHNDVDLQLKQHVT